MIICIETATPRCSVALCDRTGVLETRESDEGRSHAASLTPFIMDLLKGSGIKASDLEAVAVSKGPGSYTGLRIGVSAAKGIAYAASVPVIGIETTRSMFHGFLESGVPLTDTDLFVPMLDARRMEVYFTVFDINGKTVKETRAEVINTSSFSDLPENSRLFFFGDGSSKCRNIINRENTVFNTEFRISAAYMQKPAYEYFHKKIFEDTAYFEPFYLKDFLTTKPVRNLL